MLSEFQFAKLAISYLINSILNQTMLNEMFIMLTNTIHYMNEIKIAARHYIKVFQIPLFLLSQCVRLLH